MLFKVRVREVLEHEISIEAETEEDAMLKWPDNFGDSDFDEIISDNSYFVDIEEDE